MKTGSNRRWEPTVDRDGMRYAVAFREARSMGYSQADARDYAEREVERARRERSRDEDGG